MHKSPLREVASMLLNVLHVDTISISLQVAGTVAVSVYMMLVWLDGDDDSLSLSTGLHWSLEHWKGGA